LKYDEVHKVTLLSAIQSLKGHSADKSLEVDLNIAGGKASWLIDTLLCLSLMCTVAVYGGRLRLVYPLGVVIATAFPFSCCIGTKEDSEDVAVFRRIVNSCSKELI
jgi:hypothetical protein